MKAAFGMPLGFTETWDPLVLASTPDVSSCDIA